MENQDYIQKLQNIYDKFIKINIISSFDEFFKIICAEFNFFEPIKPIQKRQQTQTKRFFAESGKTK